MYPGVGAGRSAPMDRRELLARMATGRASAVRYGWNAVSMTSRLLARTAGLLSRGSLRLAVALRAGGRRLDRVATEALIQSRRSPPVAAPAERLADATVVMPRPVDPTIVMPAPVSVLGLPPASLPPPLPIPRLPPPGVSARGLKVPPPPGLSKPARDGDLSA
jgi:hypothetical protein